MRSRNRSLLAMVVAMLACMACAGAMTPTTISHSPSDSTVVNTNLAELQKYITLPGTPSAAQWQITRLGPDNNDDRSVPGPSTYELSAVITYAPADLAALKATSTASTDSTAVNVDEAFFLSWYPASVKAAFAKQPDGRYVFSDHRYSAQAFYKTPYDEGSLLFVSPTELLVVLISD